MSRIIMEKKICLEPSLLNENLDQHILERIKKTICGKCDQEYGYIIKVYDKIKILDNIISPAGLGVFFTVRFGIKAIKPEVGSVYNGIVCMSFKQGIFVEVFGKIKVLIPADKLGLFNWDKNTNTFKNKEISLKCKDEINIEITMIRYEKSNFNCIGSLKT